MLREGALIAMLAGALAPGLAAEPFRMAGDTPESVWVVDEMSGRLAWCRTVAGAGPKVIDVFGGDAQARPEAVLPARPDCSVVLRAEAWQAGLAGHVPAPYDTASGYGAGFGGPLSVAVRPGMLGDGSSGYQIGSAVGMLGNGTFGYGYGASDNQVIIVRPEWINVNLD
jgi:hypothetical protein